MMVRLNKRTIDEATYQGPGGCYLWDSEMAAFGVRIYPSGRKSFVVSYWSRGRRRFYTLGRFGRLTVPSVSADDPVRQASEQIGSTLITNLEGGRTSSRPLATIAEQS